MGWKSDFQRNLLQTSILERLGLDFGRFWDRILQLLQEICGALGSFCDQRSFREPSKCEPPKRAALPVPCQIRFILGGFWSPRRLQDGPRCLQEPQDAARRPQDAPKTRQDDPKRPQDAPKTPQDTPKTAPGHLQDDPKTPPRRPKIFPRRPQDGSKLPRHPKMLTRRPKRPWMPPKRPHDASRPRFWCLQA